MIGSTSPPFLVDVGTLVLTFLKIGAVVYGNGYVLLVFLRQDFVERLHRLTDYQLVDAVAVGRSRPVRCSPTPLLSGTSSADCRAVLATIAILPSFALGDRVE